MPAGATKLALSGTMFGVLLARTFSTDFRTSLDATGLTLLALASVPWLGPIFETIKVAGVEAKFREVEEKLRTVQKTAEQANGRSSAARRSAELAIGAAQAVRDNPTNRPGGPEEVARLVGEFLRIRETMVASPVRTEKMAAVVYALMDTLRGQPDFPADRNLEASGLGERLAAYAYYLVHSAGAPIDRMIDIVAAERRPFNQYWGLQAIAHVLSIRPPDTTEVPSRRRSRGSGMPPGQGRTGISPPIRSSPP